jgi:ribosomal protein L5
MQESSAYANDAGPALDKIVLNMGVGEAVGDSKKPGCG